MPADSGRNGTSKVSTRARHRPFHAAICGMLRDALIGRIASAMRALTMATMHIIRRKAASGKTTLARAP